MTSLARVCSVRSKWQGDQRDLGFASGPPRISNQVSKYSLFSTLYHHFWNNQNNGRFLKIFSSQSLIYLQKLCIANIELQNKYKPHPHFLCCRNTHGVKNQTPQTWKHWIFVVYVQDSEIYSLIMVGNCCVHFLQKFRPIGLPKDDLFVDVERTKLIVTSFSIKSSLTSAGHRWTHRIACSRSCSF